ncbi:galaxin-like, partial [Arapaima gigas]
KLFLCGSVEYCPHSNICCNGRLHLKVQGKTQCCGTELYHPAKRETRCCNGMLQLNVPEGSKCAGQSIYNPNIETVCEKNLYPVPHGQCCGKDLLKPSEELCCNGYRYPKSPGIVCCGNEAYNSSDSRQKCCSGHLHKLSSVTGMAECCGTQVVEDFTKQQCCRSSQLELIYISQPGFSCCGSQYYNSSEFSCCEEVVYSTMRFGHNFAGHVGQCSHLNLKNLSAQCCNTSVTMGTLAAAWQENMHRHIRLTDIFIIQQKKATVGSMELMLTVDHCSCPELVVGRQYLWIEGSGKRCRDKILFYPTQEIEGSLLHVVLSASKNYAN